MSTPTTPTQPLPAPVTGSDEVEESVQGHLRDIRSMEARNGCAPMPEWMAVDMAWTRWSRSVTNERLAATVLWIVEHQVKPHNALWAQLREVVLRLMKSKKATR